MRYDHLDWQTIGEQSPWYHNSEQEQLWLDSDRRYAIFGLEHEGETYENREITILGRMNQKCTKKQLKMFLFWLVHSGLFPAIVLSQASLNHWVCAGGSAAWNLSYAEESVVSKLESELRYSRKGYQIYILKKNIILFVPPLVTLLARTLRLANTFIKYGLFRFERGKTY